MIHVGVPSPLDLSVEDAEAVVCPVEAEGGGLDRVERVIQVPESSSL
jgi:hypothetical protein